MNLLDILRTEGVEYQFDYRPVERISAPREVTESGFTALVRAWKVGEHYYPDLVPSYPYDERGSAVDQEVATMVQARFDGATPFDSEQECVAAAETRFREGVRRVLQVQR